MQQKHPIRAIVVGGGIGGITAAIALRQAGVEATVYERAGELREVGAGLAVWQNAVYALGRLGLADKVRAQAVPDLGGALRSWRGETLVDLTPLNRGAGAPALSLVIHRADLLAILREELGAAQVRLGAELVGFSQDAGGVTARFADGHEARGDLLVGADGLGSAVRAQLFGRQKPRYSGYSAWRAVVEFDPALARAAAGETWGRGARFGIAPMSGGRVYWFASLNSPAGARVPEGRRKATLLERFRGWHAPVEALIDATDEAAILHHDIHDRPPLRRWSVGRVTLLGDAAHPMTPNLGQGACQAIEDGLALADALAAGGEIAAALRGYEARRVGRTSAIVRQSRQVGWVGQWQSAPACELRDFLAKRLLARLQARQIDRLVHYRV
ncbi:MAG: FAD-dependent monooxygenase [Kouleothrix sp.]|nr:FAD-dependent monooxygenase [Kouleothrix sp.]